MRLCDVIFVGKYPLLQSLLGESGRALLHRKSLLLAVFALSYPQEQARCAGLGKEAPHGIRQQCFSNGFSRSNYRDEHRRLGHVQEGFVTRVRRKCLLLTLSGRGTIESI